MFSFAAARPACAAPRAPAQFNLDNVELFLSAAHDETRHTLRKFGHGPLPDGIEELLRDEAVKRVRRIAARHRPEIRAWPNEAIERGDADPRLLGVETQVLPHTRGHFYRGCALFGWACGEGSDNDFLPIRQEDEHDDGAILCAFVLTAFGLVLPHETIMYDHAGLRRVRHHLTDRHAPDRASSSIKWSSACASGEAGALASA